MDGILNLPHKEQILKEPISCLAEETKIVKSCIKYFKDNNIQLSSYNNLFSFLDIKILNDKIIAITNDHKKISIFCDDEGLYYIYDGKKETYLSHNEREVVKAICWCVLTPSFYTKLRRL